MTHPASILLAGSGECDRVGKILKSAGYRCQSAPLGDNLVTTITEHSPGVVILQGDAGNGLETLARLKSDRAARHIPVVGLGMADAGEAPAAFYDAGADELFETGADEAEILARLPAVMRISAMESELVRRSATAADFGVKIANEVVPEASEAGYRLLVVGTDTGGMDAISPHLSGAAFEVVAEPDFYRARSWVGENQGERFDAALVYVHDDESRDKAAYFCRSLRNDRRLFDFPVYLAAANRVFSGPGEAYSTGASLFGPAPLVDRLFTIHLQLLMRARHRKRALGRELAKSLVTETGDVIGKVFSRDFLGAHLKRLAQDGASRGVISSAILFFVPTVADIAARYGDDAAGMLCSQMADWISALVRVEDIAGRVGTDEFLVLLPETGPEDAEIVRNRVVGVLHESEFRLTDNVPVGVEAHLQSAMTSVGRDDTVESVTRRASEALT